MAAITQRRIINSCEGTIHMICLTSQSKESGCRGRTASTRQIKPIKYQTDQTSQVPDRSNQYQFMSIRLHVFICKAITEIPPSPGFMLDNWDVHFCTSWPDRPIMGLEAWPEWSSVTIETDLKCLLLLCKHWKLKKKKKKKVFQDNSTFRFVYLLTMSTRCKRIFFYKEPTLSTRCTKTSKIEHRKRSRLLGKRKKAFLYVLQTRMLNHPRYNYFNIHAMYILYFIFNLRVDLWHPPKPSEYSATE